MARRTTKKQQSALGLFVILGLIVVLGVVKIIAVLWIFIILGIGIYAFHKHNQSKRRVEYLRMKYGSDALVQHILQHHFWQGQTSEQLLDALGNPVSVDKVVLKTRKREIWKYNRRGVNRFGLRVTLDDDIVVGWNEKA